MFWKIFETKILRWNKGDEEKNTEGFGTVCWTNKLKRNSADRVFIFSNWWPFFSSDLHHYVYPADSGHTICFN